MSSANVEPKSENLHNSAPNLEANPFEYGIEIVNLQFQ